jgi:hypothetical protein
MTRAERSQQHVDDVLLKLSGYTWKRRKHWYGRNSSYRLLLEASDRQVIAIIRRPRKKYYVYPQMARITAPIGGPFPTLAKAKAYVAKKLGCRGKA